MQSIKPKPALSRVFLLFLATFAVIVINAFTPAPTAAQTPLSAVRAVAHSDYAVPGLAPDVRFNAENADHIFGLAGSHVAFLASTDDAPFDWAVWHQGPTGQTQIIAAPGSPAPGLAPGYHFAGTASLIPNAAGDIVFFSQAFKPGDGFHYSLWIDRQGSLDIFAPYGTPAPGLPGRLHQSVLHMAMNDAAQVAFLGLATDDLNEYGNVGIWSEGGGNGLQLVAAKDLPTPGLPGEHFVFLESPLINPQGQVTFKSSITENGSGIRGSLWTGSDYDDIRPVVTVGDPYGGFPGSKFINIGNNPQIDAAGTIYFNGTVSSSAGELGGIWKSTSAGLEELVRQDLITPYAADPTITLANIWDVAASDNGTIAFPAYLQGPAVNENNDASLWRRTPQGEISLVIREGDTPPAWSEPLVFYSDPQASINSRGQVAFNAEFQRPGQVPFIGTAILATDLAGNLHTVVRTGDLIDVDSGPGVDLRSVTGVSFGGNGSFASGGGFTGGISNSGGQLSRFNNRGELLFQAQFADGSVGYFISSVVAVPEPSTATILTLALAAFLSTRKVLGRHGHLASAESGRAIRARVAGMPLAAAE